MRRRIQAVPIPGASSSFGIGVSLTPIGTAAPAAIGSCATAPALYVDSAVVTPEQADAPEDASGCSYIVLLLGVGPGATVEWSLEWARNNVVSADGVFFGSLSAFSIGILTSVFDVSWIDVICSVDGVTYVTRIDNACSF